MSPSVGEGPLVGRPRKGGRRLGRWARRAALAAVVVVGVTAALAATWRVTSIRIEGAVGLSPEAILRAAELTGGERMLLTRFGAVEARVERLPAIREAEVRRSLPSAVVIAVRERQPLARLGGTERLVAGREGVVFEGDTGRPLPVLVGWDGEARAGARLDPPAPSALAAFGGFPETLRTPTTRIELGGEELTLILTEGTEIRFGEPVDLDAKGAAAAAVLSATSGRDGSVAYVDVRSPEAPVVRDREPASPSPEPGAGSTP